MKKHLENLNNDYIRYANCWEDAEVLLEGLDIQPSDRILSIGSAGDNSFSLLSKNPKLVVAVDINPVQLALIELKKAAFKSLSHEEFCAFLGFSESEERMVHFAKVSENLSEEWRLFWENRIEVLNNGVIHQGKFENYFGMFREKVLPWIHDEKKIDQLFFNKSSDQQLNFFQKKWNTWKWKALFKIFFSKFVMGRFGRDPQFLKEVRIPVSQFILEQAEKHLSSAHCQKNPFLHYIMKGEFGNLLPHYARKENFDLIKSNIDQLQVFKGFAQDAFEQFEGFNKFNLSNIFEYMDQDTFAKTTENLVENGSSGSKYVYWNLMVPRRMSMVSELRWNEKLSQLLTRRDYGFFYSQLHVDTKL